MNQITQIVEAERAGISFLKGYAARHSLARFETPGEWRKVSPFLAHIMDNRADIVGNLGGISGALLSRTRVAGKNIVMKFAVEGFSESQAHFSPDVFSTAHREALFVHLASKHFSLGKYFPETSLVFDRIESRFCSLQEYIESALLFNSKKESHVQEIRKMDQNDLMKLHLMDRILGNTDRHGENVLFCPSTRSISNDSKNDASQYELKLIDHGFSFDYSGFLKIQEPAYSRHLMGTEISQDVRDWFSQISIDDIVQTAAEYRLPEPLRIKMLSLFALMRSAIEDGSIINLRDVDRRLGFEGYDRAAESLQANC